MTGLGEYFESRSRNDGSEVFEVGGSRNGVEFSAEDQGRAANSLCLGRQVEPRQLLAPEVDADFVSLNDAFDSEILLQASHFGFRIAEVPARSIYLADASSISFRPALVYGLKTVGRSARLLAHRTRFPILRSRRFER